MKFLWDQPVLSYSTHGSQKSGAIAAAGQSAAMRLQHIGFELQSPSVFQCFQRKTQTVGGQIHN